MNDALSTEKGFPQWYLAINGGKIIGGLGVIENDFHERKDLSPNVCAVFVEESARKIGVARALLSLVCNDMKEKGIDMLCLLTDLTSFYEHCGREFPPRFRRRRKSALKNVCSQKLLIQCNYSYKNTRFSS